MAVKKPVPVTNVARVAAKPTTPSKPAQSLPKPGPVRTATIVKNALASILPGKPRVTQAFGNYNPSVEKFSKGVNYGTDFAVKPGTPVGVPQGQWKVVESFSGAKGGFLGDKTNRGYGNSILVQNVNTGEKMRFSHLSHVGVQNGQVIGAGQPIGLTGATGNVTGPHLDLEYYDSNGHIADVLKSSYAGGLQGQGSALASAPQQDYGSSSESTDNPVQQAVNTISGQQTVRARPRMDTDFASYGDEQDIQTPTWLMPSVTTDYMSNDATITPNFNQQQDMGSTPTPTFQRAIPKPNINTGGTINNGIYN